MFIMGILSCGAMWLLAPLLAAGDARMIPVFRSLAWPTVADSIVEPDSGLFPRL
jgi:hypothetical protein